MSPYTNLSLFLIISSTHYISHPKILKKSAATVVFITKISQVLVLKKIVNSTQTFLLACGLVVVPLHKLFSLVHQTAIILTDKTQFHLFHMQKNIIIFPFLGNM